MTASALKTFLDCFADALDRDGLPVSRSHAGRLRRLAPHRPPLKAPTPAPGPVP